MAQPTNRAEFIEWCLRKLGKPVIEINVDKDQVEDRVDEALSYYWDYHFDGAEKIYLKHQVTQADKDNGYLTIPESVLGVVNIFNINSTWNFSNDLFNVRYQFLLNHLHDIYNYDLTYYYQNRQYIQFMEEILVGQQPIRYNRHVNRLYIDTDWNQIAVGQYIIAECYQVIDPNTYSDVWKDRWLQNYATAKIQETWGRNMSKFEGMQLPGGIQFNGRETWEEARQTIEKLEEEMISSYSLPIADMIG